MMATSTSTEGATPMGINVQVRTERGEVREQLVDYFPSPQDMHALDPSYEDTVEGYDPENARILKDLQKMEGVGLVVPVGEEHMYYAAMNSAACRLTALGAQYWRLAKERKL